MRDAEEQGVEGHADEKETHEVVGKEQGVEGHAEVSETHDVGEQWWGGLSRSKFMLVGGGSLGGVSSGGVCDVWRVSVLDKSGVF